MPGFDVLGRAACLALQSRAEDVEELERTVSRAASAYGVKVDLVVLP